MNIRMEDIVKEEVNIDAHPTDDEIKAQVHLEIDGVPTEVNIDKIADEVQSTTDEVLTKADATFTLAMQNLLKLYGEGQQEILEQARLKHLSAYNERPNYKKLFGVLASLPITQDMTREQAIQVVTDSLGGLKDMKQTPENATFLKELGQEMVVLVAVSMNAVFKGDLNLASLSNFMNFITKLKDHIK